MIVHFCWPYKKVFFRHAHVIENGHCHLCDITISSQRTKHCSACNKCVDSFDHHCKWLNQCIGKRNYAWFFASVVTAVLIAALYFASALAVFILFYVQRESLRPWAAETGAPGNGMMDMTNNSSTSENEAVTRFFQQSNGDFLLSGNESFYSTMTTTPQPAPAQSDDSSFQVLTLSVPNSIMLTMLCLSSLLALVAAALLVHLCFFHLFINHVGITTYEYVRAQRLEQERRARESNVSREEEEEHEEEVEAEQEEDKTKCILTSCCSSVCCKRETQVSTLQAEEEERTRSKYRPGTARMGQRRSMMEQEEESAELRNNFRSRRKRRCCFCLRKRRHEEDEEQEAVENGVGQSSTKQSEEIFTINVEQRKTDDRRLSPVVPAPQVQRRHHQAVVLPPLPQRQHSSSLESATDTVSSPLTDVTQLRSSTAASSLRQSPTSSSVAKTSESTVPKLPSISVGEVDTSEAARARRKELRRLEGDLKVEEASGLPGATEIISFEP